MPPISIVRKALALDPGDSAVQRRYGQLLGDLGRLPEAIATLKKAPELDPLSSPAWETLSLYLMWNRQFAAAHEAVRRALEIQPESVYGRNDLGMVQLLEGKAAEDKAFEWLERAYQQRDGGLSSIKDDTLLASLRGDPRYKAFLRNMNLPE